MNENLEKLMDFHNAPGKGWSWYSIVHNMG